MQVKCIQDMTAEPIEPVREEMRSLRRRMVLDLEWFLSQGLAVENLPPPAAAVGGSQGILLDGRVIEEKPW